jgi:hypothetical protein
MITMFATDLDGTLLKQNRYITKEDKQALQYLYNNGVDITIATGRSDREVQAVFKELDITGHRISQNGTFAFSKDNQEIYSHTFSNDVSVKLFDFLHRHEFPCLISNFDDIHYAKDMPVVQTLQPLFKTPLVFEPELKQSLHHDFATSKFMLLGDTEALLALETEINQLFPHDVSTFLSAQQCLDVVPKGADKSHALQALIQTTKTDVQKTVSIGDSFNDTSMLSFTGYSYAMQEAPVFIQSHAQKVVRHVHEAVTDLIDLDLV